MKNGWEGEKVEEEGESNVWLFSRDDVIDSPSRADAISYETERKIVASSVRYILELAEELQIPQLTRCAAIKFFQRFYMVESMYCHSPPAVATACLFIACKVQECVKHLSDVIYYGIKVQTRTKEFPDGEDVLEKSQRFQDEKNLVLTKERNVLRVLNFELEMDHPYRYIVTLVKTYAADANQQRQLSQAGWNFINDSLRTYIHVQYTDREIATAALYLGALFCQVMLGNNVADPTKPWYTHYDIQPHRIVEIGNCILDLYDL